MGRISIFNYEVFYLDYLEGKLGEEDVTLLLQFFEEHPECELEDTELPVLFVDYAPIYKGKSSLKQVDDGEAITANNVEYFMISDTEGILSNDKKEELNSFVAENASLVQTRNRYKAVYFTPDSTIIFQNKEGIKRKKVFVLWPYISTAIAAAIISFVILINEDGTSHNIFKNNPMAFMPKNEIPKKIDQNSGLNENQTVVEENLNPKYSASNKNTHKPNKRIVDEKEMFISMKHRKAHDLETSFDKKLSPMTTFPESLPNELVNNTPEPVFVANNMKNPIEPVTSFISRKTNTEIDFGTKKASKREKGGFFFKVGKFEISKNKH